MPFLLDNSDYLLRINGDNDFVSESEFILKPGFYELMTRLANALNAAKLKGSYLMKVEMIVHIQEEDNV